MFEEVPRERRGLARLVPVRRVALGPFVLGGGMLLATLGGSVAVAAAAATMITASAIGFKDVPADPGHAVSSAVGTQQALSARRPPAHHQAVMPTAPGRSTPAHRNGAAAVPSMPPHLAALPSSAGAAPPPPARTGAAVPPARSTSPSAVPSTSADQPSQTPVPSSSDPLGNAVIHVSGYRPASNRLAYQFASVRPGAGIGGGDLYQVLAPDTFTASLAPSATITSGGGICAPAGSACTVDQVIQAADSGFYALAAIDAQGELRSLIEVGYQPVTPKLTPAPSTTAAGQNLERIRPWQSPPPPSSSPGASS